jgi:hypothetical protein
MAHTSLETTLNPVDREFRDMVQHGDDFFKVELLKHAKSWYQKALKMNIETETVKQKIENCNKLLKFERKVTWVLIAIAAVAIISWYLLSN